MKALNRIVIVLILSSLYLHNFAQTPLKADTDTEFKVNSRKKFEKQLKRLPLFSQSFSGFCVFDASKGEYVVEHDADKYFTPASNTKLFTFYAALNYIGDSIPALQYVQRGDSLIIWGTGNPTLLHPQLADSAALQFLSKSGKTIYYSTSNFHQDHFGNGWAWNDYTEYYSAELSSLPLYGNLAVFSDTKGQIQVSPELLRDSLRKTASTGRLHVDRQLFANQYTYSVANNAQPRTVEMPMRMHPKLIAALLAKATGQPVQWINEAPLASEKPQTLYTRQTEAMYRKMLQESDNFLAEQILLMCSNRINNSNYISSQTVIKHLTDNQLSDLTQAPRWVDGSGLSRYNLFTPRNMVELLRKIHDEFGNTEAKFRYILSLLPESGKSGTIKRRFTEYPGAIFAKTGTLSNNHNLSGYLFTKSGKLLIFSYMNNHYMVPTSEVRKQTDKILTDFYLNY